MIVRALTTAPTRILVRPTLRRGKIEAHNSCLLPHTEYSGSATIRGRGLHSASGGNVSTLYRGSVSDKEFSETGQGKKRKREPGL
jgi:hypothetical protein